MQDAFETANQFKIKVRASSHKKGITAIRWSSGGRLLGVADDGGYLVVRETEHWNEVRKLKASAPIRAFEFHPIDQHALVVGCTNGDIIKLVLDPKSPGGDFYGLESVDGFIHAMAFDDEGYQVAVAYANRMGMHTKVFTLDSFRESWGNGRFLPTPIIDQTSFSGYPFVRNIVFLTSNKILLSFFPDTLGLRVFNIGRIPFQMEKKIKLRPGTLIGGSAVSPSRQIVAVMNMLDGIDIYDIARARLIKTIEYDLAELYMVDIRFLDEERLVSGYSRGTLVIADCSHPTSIIPIMIEGANIDPLQAVAVAIIDGVLWVAAGSVPVHDNKGRVVLFRRDIEDSGQNSRKGSTLQMLNKVPVIVKYSLAAMILSIFVTTFIKFPSEGSGAVIVPIPTTLRATNPGTVTVSAVPDDFIQPTPETKTVTTTMSAVTRIATIPGPITTTTRLIVERITETSAVATTISVEMSRTTPACTTRTLFEMSTHTVTATVERGAATCTPPICSHDTCNSYQRALGYLCDACGIAAVCLLVWSFYSNGRDSIPGVLDIVAEGDVDALKAGNNGASLRLSEETKYDDVVDNADSIVGTIETESSRGGGESDEESALDDVEERGMVFDTVPDLDAEDFAKGVNVDEQDMEGSSFGDDDEANHTNGEPIMEGDASEDEGPQEEPAVQTYVSGDEGVDRLQESAVNVGSTESVVADEASEVARAAGEATAAQEEPVVEADVAEDEGVDGSPKTQGNTDEVRSVSQEPAVKEGVVTDEESDIMRATGVASAADHVGPTTLKASAQVEPRDASGETKTTAGPVEEVETDPEGREEEESMIGQPKKAGRRVKAKK